MPRVADHQQRRSELSAAVGALIADGGLGAVTVARVAAAAGCSVGLVQHYFPAKDELLVFAYEQTLAGIEERAAAHVSEGVTHRRSIAHVVEAGLAELLPLDDGRRAEYRVVRAFTGRAVERARLGEAAAATAGRLRTMLATAVTNGKECGEVDLRTDAAPAAMRLLATAEGLAAPLYHESGIAVGTRTMSEVVLEVLGDAVATVFPGECRQYG